MYVCICMYVCMYVCCTLSSTTRCAGFSVSFRPAIDSAAVLRTCLPSTLECCMSHGPWYAKMAGATNQLNSRHLPIHGKIACQYAERAPFTKDVKQDFSRAKVFTKLLRRTSLSLLIASFQKQLHPPPPQIYVVAYTDDVRWGSQVT